MNIAQLCFILLTVGSLAIVGVAARRRIAGADELYTGGSRLRAWQNGLALSGDYLSAAAFLGAAGMWVGQGYDSLIYAVGTLAGWPLLMILLADRLRELGRYTVADVLEHRFPGRPVRLMSSAASLLITGFYLTVQMVAGGKLMALLFGIPYPAALAGLSALILLYATAGGMRATTWAQMAKAALLLATASALAAGVWLRHDGGLGGLIADVIARHPAGAGILQPSPAMSSPWEVLSLGIGLVFGLLGLPHVLMRFFTVPDAATARRSVAWATGLIALMFTLNALIGAGAIVYVNANPAFHDAQGHLTGGGNMVVLHLADYLGGELFRAVVSAVAFATLLAVVAGLTLAGSATIGHDIYARLIRGRIADNEELAAARLASVGLVVGAALLALACEQQNIAFLMGLAFAVSASAQAPVLILTLYWPGFTRRGALWTGWTGMAASAFAVFSGPAFAGGGRSWHFPLANPTLFSLSLALAAGLLASRLERQSHHPGTAP
ncbi:solute symporter family protein [Paludibacterium paludis]|uniref:Cation/acetate symporter ActP n=1 Tax=Paludibacterium paludis TaxID=1225769 RepID=A0A918P6R9_9NEIS|nr:cation/acetate symporter ActP [Paludibacterium paludis]GGY27686.1 cation/acetate symporter ActP [Paludibacterium paludis]